MDTPNLSETTDKEEEKGKGKEISNLFFLSLSYHPSIEDEGLYSILLNYVLTEKSWGLWYATVLLTS